MRRKKWGTLTRLPLPSAKQSSWWLLSPQVRLNFHRGSLDAGQALLSLSKWHWGMEVRRMELLTLYFPLPNLFGSKEHWTASDGMGQAHQPHPPKQTPLPLVPPGTELCKKQTCTFLFSIKSYYFCKQTSALRASLCLAMVYDHGLFHHWQSGRCKERDIRA